ncbi:homoserine kinase [Pseudemcibacter aquimaris]|uniref:homoserine kinase n=1 Tax=Pseudemcibacter aquimaris TaxID=2857064 RepID=UPI002011B23D|nr:homoserine kinase [Pseudemcibacter aquimaris]MCC3862327.1 homoserine kinase [Pseudemcibacter aquimaris]WDU59075.1 homoserine kinase [Pseudemcibacter aquimaris]
MAVYTHVTANDIAEFLEAFDVGEVVSFKGIAEGVENSNYLLATTKDKFILTLFEKRVNEDDLPFFMNLMKHLSDKGINCAEPVADKNGEVLKTLCGRPTALIGFLNGLSVTKPSAKNCRDLGIAMAEMHLAVADFDMSRANDLSLAGWVELAEKCETRADECKQGLSAIVHNEMEFLKDAWPNNLPEGIIHADLFTDNVFFLDDELSGLIDYYFSCHDALAYDVAICINAWCFEEDGSFNATKAANLVKGYQSIRPLTDEEIDALPILCRGSAMRFLLTRLYDWLNQVEGALVKVKDPLEYLSKLQFHQKVKSAGEYGVETS